MRNRNPAVVRGKVSSDKLCPTAPYQGRTKKIRIDAYTEPTHLKEGSSHKDRQNCLISHNCPNRLAFEVRSTSPNLDSLNFEH